MTWKLQEITVDGAPILPTIYPTKAEAMAAGKAEGERVGHLPHCVDWLCRIDVIWAGRANRDDRFTAWSAPQVKGDRIMKLSATFVKRIKGHRSDRRLYKLSAPYQVKDWNGEIERTILHVVTSAIVVDISGPETYVFAADDDGGILDWAELPGSFRGSLDHDAAIRAFLAAT